MTAAPLIEIEQLSFHFRPEQLILEDISLAIESGDYIGVIGPNGSGKTTLVKLMLGLLPLQTGRVALFGQPLADFKDWKKVGYVPQAEFQGDANFPATVEEVVAAGFLAGSWIQKSEVRKELRLSVKRSMDLVGIAHLIGRRIGELSGGEQQRVFIAQALVTDPSLLILDEPTAGIDLAAEDAFYGLLHSLNTEHGKTILLVSHDLEALAHHTKKALCLNRKIVYFGPAEGLHERTVVEAAFGIHARHFHETP